MLYMSSSPMDLTTIHVLVMTHPENFKSPMVEQALSMIKYRSKQVIRVGEHMLTQGRLNTFDSVVIPAVDDRLWQNMLTRLKQGYGDLLKQYSNMQDKQLIVYGNIIQMLPSKILKIPRTEPLHRANILRGISGLDILPVQIDINFEPKYATKAYLNELKRFSVEHPIYLLDPTVMYSPDGDIRNGNIYKSDKKGIHQVAQVILPKRMKDKEVFNKRELPKIKYLYEQESTSEKAQEQVAKTVASTDDTPLPPPKLPAQSS